MGLTLGIQEVVHQHVMATGRVDGSVMEEILVLLGANSHVLLTQVVHVSIDVVCVLGSCELPLRVSVPR